MNNKYRLIVDCSESERIEAMLPYLAEWQTFAPYCTNKRTAETQRIDKSLIFTEEATKNIRDARNCIYVNYTNNAPVSSFL